MNQTTVDLPWFAIQLVLNKLSKGKIVNDSAFSLSASTPFWDKVACFSDLNRHCPASDPNLRSFARGNVVVAWSVPSQQRNVSRINEAGCYEPPDEERKGMWAIGRKTQKVPGCNEYNA